MYILTVSGSNSAVECDLAKVEVAGSNPVSRSIFPNLRLAGRSVRLATRVRLEARYPSG